MPEVVGVSDFDDFHNTPKKLSDRNLMLSGSWPQGGCEYCQNIEMLGGSSDRMFHLKIPGQYPHELASDPKAIHVSPTILEVYLDNVCNMSCVYCWDGFSSQIQHENNKFGVFQKDGVLIKNTAVKHPEHQQLKEKFWSWMEEHYNSLSRLNILGGEPFYQSDFETCLHFLELHKNAELEFNVVSNLMIKHEKFVKHISRIKQLVDQRKILRFDLTASIDCWGPAQEYVRYGLDLQTWQKNFEYLVSEPWIVLNINQTLSGLTIKNIPELLLYVKKFRTSGRIIGQYMSPTVHTHDFLHPKIFGKDFFQEDFNLILSTMTEDDWQASESKKYFQGLIGEINSHEKNYSEIFKLGIFLDEMDRRRRLDWKKTFPWLVSEVEKCGIIA
jgi:organic radical activating enzyme